VTAGRQRRCWLLSALLLVACRGSVPPSLLLSVVNGDGVAAPDNLRLQVFDENGAAHASAAWPVSGGARALGTVVIYPRSASGLSLRVQALGIKQDEVVSAATVAVQLAATGQSRAVVTLHAPGSDRDGDGVADEIDNCADIANPEQADGDGDGTGDGCAGVDGGEDGGVDPDAGEDAPSPDQDGGGPGTQKLGAPCQQPSGCKSGFCVDGVCCESSCEQACQVCNRADQVGRCAPVPARQPEPHGRCISQAAETCGLDGTCDGGGQCARHGAGTVCQAPRCSSAADRTLPGTCDGAGNCRPGASQSCDPYACAGDACKTSCDGAGDCSGGNPCINRSCGKSPLGAGCESGDTCNSGNCVDGVCCDLPSCAGPCRACNLAGASGSCQNLPANAEPRTADCPAQATTTCGRTGRCDGAGNCQLHAPGTICGARSCNADSETPAPSCNGSGLCVPGTTRSCGDYLCAADACFTSCSSDSQCAATAYCLNNLCTARRSAGGSCSEGRECATGNCSDGHCCQVASCPMGQACNGPGGTCTDKQAAGTACTAGSECASGFCIDSVCCTTACTEPCRRCDAAPAGTCQIIPSGRDSNSTPACVPPSRCTLTGACQVN
jgi:hypothetical protein